MLEVLGEASVSIEPCKGAVDHSSSWMDNKAGLVCKLADDLDANCGRHFDASTVVSAFGVGKLHTRVPTS
jgi:hypothetical protein